MVGAGAWEPILNRATWEQVRAILNDPGRASQVGRPPKYLLPGFLRCGMEDCGAKLVSRPLTSHGRTKPNYVCIATGKLHLAIAAGPVDELVTERVLDRLDHTGLVKVLAARAMADDTKALAEQLTRDDAALTHTPSPMRWLNELLDRPAEERAFVVVPVGYAAEGATVPDIDRKRLDEVLVLSGET